MQRRTLNSASCDVAHALLLTNIANQIKLRLLGIEWDYVYVDGLVDSTRSFRYISLYASKTEEQMRMFRFTYQQFSIIEHAFLALHDFGLRSPESRWNKSRFIYRNAGSEHSFEYCCDPDYLWLDSLDSESPDYAQLAIGDELAILAWEGLHPDHPRPWKKIKQQQCLEKA